MYNTEDLGNSIMTIRYKLVFVGDISVGKTAVMNRFINNNFSGDYDVNIIYINFFIILQPTIGVDFATKTITYKDSSLKLQIWDSAGQERYKSLIPSYVRGASIIFILYDVSKKNSFTNVITWINFIKEVNTDESLLVLCGNKIDLNREVSTSEGKILAEKEKMLFFETSAKTGNGVTNMMYTCIANLPFFEQFEITNKDNLVRDLANNNGNSNNNINEGKMLEINYDKNNASLNGENSTNIIITKKNNEENSKKKCGC